MPPVDPRKSDLLQGTLDMLILKVVALGPIHGYAIAQRLQQMSEAVLRVQQGSLYPALHRLEKRRWLKAEWAASETGRAWRKAARLPSASAAPPCSGPVSRGWG